MQIRKQLRRMANAANAIAAGRERPITPEPNGYAGEHHRIRHKSNKGPRMRGSGTAPRRTKKKGGGAGQ
ncbi:MAG: hypothetical protein HYW79_00670 [Parcubacteria group bacterium]|nr:hypothetical protein [Parcubacteria group bacterium]